MHGVIVQVKIDQDREAEARQMLADVVVPSAKALIGFISGNWFRELQGDRGISVLLFESAEAAQAAAEQIRSQGPPPGVPVTMETVDEYELLLQA